MKLKVRWAVPKDSAFSGELGTPNIGGARDLAKQGDLFPPAEPSFISPRDCQNFMPTRGSYVTRAPIHADPTISVLECTWFTGCAEILANEKRRPLLVSMKQPKIYLSQFPRLALWGAPNRCYRSETFTLGRRRLVDWKGISIMSRSVVCARMKNILNCMVRSTLCLCNHFFFFLHCYHIVTVRNHSQHLHVVRGDAMDSVVEHVASLLGHWFALTGFVYPFVLTVLFNRAQIVQTSLSPRNNGYFISDVITKCMYDYRTRPNIQSIAVLQKWV